VVLDRVDGVAKASFSRQRQEILATVEWDTVPFAEAQKFVAGSPHLTERKSTLSCLILEPKNIRVNSHLLESESPKVSG